MDIAWDVSRKAFADAAQWFVAMTSTVGDSWGDPGLGEWDVRSLVGHTSRSMLTVESYLARPAATVELTSPAQYFRAVGPISGGDAVARRGRDAGAALGADPAAAVAEIADRVLPLVDSCDGAEILPTAGGGMRLADYLPTRTFELAVHTADLAAAIGAPQDVPRSAAEQALRIVAELALDGGLAGPMLLAATGRPGWSFSVL